MTELGKGKVYLDGVHIGAAEKLEIHPDRLALKNFHLGAVDWDQALNPMTKLRDVTIKLQAVEYNMRNLKKAMPEVFRAMRQLNHAISTAFGRKPFYKRRRTRSMRGK